MSDDAVTVIQVWNSDALDVRGDFSLQDADGGEFRQHGRVRLCRCGESRIKPYCDNSHLRTGFRSQVSADS